MNIMVELDLDEVEANTLLKNSVERVINASVKLAFLSSPSDREDADINISDWEALKPLTVKIWFAVREAVFKAKKEQILSK